MRHCVKLLADLQRLVAFTYWWPEKELDGYKAERLVQVDKEKYFSDLKRISKSYVESVDSMCKALTGVRKHLDKPNLHRLIELYEHSIPAFGHAREFMELVFEGAHQPLKRCIAQSNSHDAHISAVEHCVGNDWQGRLSTLYSELLDNDATNKSTKRRAIRRLLLGEEAFLLNDENDKAFIDETDDMLLKLFCPALERHLAKEERAANFCVTKKSMWFPRGATSLKWISEKIDISIDTFKDIVHRSTQWINAVVPPITLEEDTVADIRIYKNAKRVRLSAQGRIVGRSYGHDVLTTGCVAQAYVDPGARGQKVIFPSSHANATSCFFAVIAVLQRKEDHTWAICLRCQICGEKLKTTGGIGGTSLQILLLSPAVRRVAIQHACSTEGEEGSTCEVCPGN